MYNIKVLLCIFEKILKTNTTNKNGYYKIINRNEFEGHYIRLDYISWRVFMKKKLITVICLILIVSLMTGCTTFTNFKNAFFANDMVQSDTIKIGVFEPLSGKNKEYGNLELMGIELAHEMKDEVLGKKIELIVGDNKGEIDVAETVINELVAKNPAVILGSYGETMTLAASDVIKENGIPAIAITSTNPLITINNGYYFCATFAEAKQGDALANFVYSGQKITTVATVKIAGDDTATANIQRFNNRMKNLTKSSSSVAGNFTIAAEATEYTESIKQIKDSGAKAVFLDVPPVTAEAFLKQAYEGGLKNTLFVGPKTWDDENFLNYIKTSKKHNIAYASDYNVETSASGASKEFLKAFKAKYGQDAEPSQATAIAYDAYMMAVKAIEDGYNNMMAWDIDAMVADAATEDEGKAIKKAYKDAKEAGIPTGAAIRDALKAVNGYEGVSGTISYNGTNEAAKSIEIVYYEKGEVDDHGLTVDDKDTK